MYQWGIGCSKNSPNQADASRSLKIRLSERKWPPKLSRKAPAGSAEKIHFSGANISKVSWATEPQLSFPQWLQETACGFKPHLPLSFCWDATEVNLVQLISLFAIMPGVLPGHPAGLQHPVRGLNNSKSQNHLVGRLLRSASPTAHPELPGSLN